MKNVNRLERLQNICQKSTSEILDSTAAFKNLDCLPVELKFDPGDTTLVVTIVDAVQGLVPRDFLKRAEENASKFEL